MEWLKSAGIVIKALALLSEYIEKKHVTLLIDGLRCAVNNGDVFQDNGFISTTRDPFYSPGIKMDFGLILIRINIPMRIKGSGLLMENFSIAGASGMYDCPSIIKDVWIMMIKDCGFNIEIKKLITEVSKRKL